MGQAGEVCVDILMENARKDWLKSKEVQLERIGVVGSVGAGHDSDDRHNVCRTFQISFQKWM